MRYKGFPEETKNLLQENPYVERVTESSLRFTPEFKIMASQSITLNMTDRQKNEKIRALLESVGINPQLLSHNQISSIRIVAVKLIKDAYEFQKEEALLKETRRIKRLEHEVTYLKQEQEFIKKILSAANKDDT